MKNLLAKLKGKVLITLTSIVLGIGAVVAVTGIETITAEEALVRENAICVAPVIEEVAEDVAIVTE